MTIQPHTSIRLYSETVPPDEFQAAAEIHDLQTHLTFIKLLNLDNITTSSWAQAMLSIRHGGFSLTSSQNLSPIAFVVGWVQSLHTLPSSCPDTISYKFAKVIEFRSAAPDLLTDTKKLQHRLSEKLVRAQVLHMIENAGCCSLMSLHGKDSGSWLGCIPSS